MDAQLQNAAAAAAAPAPEIALNVVIVYEDFLTGIRAKETFDRLARLVGTEEAVTSSMWKFDVLRLPPLRDIAAQEAAVADLVILSTYEENELPLAVRNWINRWLALKRVGNGALVALLNHQTQWAPGTAAARAYLREVATRAHMDFFPLTASMPETELDLSTETIAERAQKISSLLEGILHQHPAPPYAPLCK